MLALSVREFLWKFWFFRRVAPGRLMLVVLELRNVAAIVIMLMCRHEGRCDVVVVGVSRVGIVRRVMEVSARGGRAWLGGPHCGVREVVKVVELVGDGDQALTCTRKGGKCALSRPTTLQADEACELVFSERSEQVSGQGPFFDSEYCGIRAEE